MMAARGWGPHFCRDGSTVFRLWAPAEFSLALEIDGRRLSMERQDEGWFAVRLDSQPVGALYGLVLSDGRRVLDPEVIGPYDASGTLVVDQVASSLKLVRHAPIPIAGQFILDVLDDRNELGIAEIQIEFAVCNGSNVWQFRAATIVPGRRYSDLTPTAHFRVQRTDRFQAPILEMLQFTRSQTPTMHRRC